MALASVRETNQRKETSALSVERRHSPVAQNGGLAASGEAQGRAGDSFDRSASTRTESKMKRVPRRVYVYLLAKAVRASHSPDRGSRAIVAGKEKIAGRGRTLGP